MTGQKIAAGVIMLSLAGLVSACSRPLTTREKGALIGGGAGAATGAIIGGAVGAPGTGALVGGALGAGGGALAGQELEKRKQLDRDVERQREELERLKRQQQEE